MDLTQWPANEVTSRKCADLKPHPRNSRTHSNSQVQQVARSIETWGFTIPILVNEEGLVLAGHCRLRAAQLLGMLQVPTLTAQGWTDEQQRAYIIADNRLTELGSWDQDTLREEVVFLSAQDVDVSTLGYDDVQLSGMLNNVDDSLFTLPGEADKTPSACVEHTKTEDGYASFSIVLPVLARNKANKAVRAYMQSHGIADKATAFTRMMETF